MILVIDNYDSFTYNLVQYLGELGEEIVVKRNDEIDLAGIEALAPDHILISPGPCSPNEAGISLSLIEHFKGRNSDLRRLPGPSIDRTSVRRRSGARREADARQNICRFIMTENRYLQACHRLLRLHATIRLSCGVRRCRTAWRLRQRRTKAKLWALRHKEYPIEGVQFHPESIITEHGLTMLRNFLQNRAGAVR